MSERKRFCDNFWILVNNPDQLPPNLNQPETLDYNEIGEIRTPGVYSTEYKGKTLIRVVGPCPNLDPNSYCCFLQSKGDCCTS